MKLFNDFLAYLDTHLNHISKWPLVSPIETPHIRNKPNTLLIQFLFSTEKKSRRNLLNYHTGISYVIPIKYIHMIDSIPVSYRKEEQ